MDIKIIVQDTESTAIKALRHSAGVALSHAAMRHLCTTTQLFTAYARNRPVSQIEFQGMQTTGPGPGLQGDPDPNKWVSPSNWTSTELPGGPDPDSWVPVQLPQSPIGIPVYVLPGEIGPQPPLTLQNATCAATAVLNGLGDLGWAFNRDLGFELLLGPFGLVPSVVWGELEPSEAY
jgi:hypothetical protein